jgi:hypothetical protein
MPVFMPWPQSGRFQWEKIKKPVGSRTALGGGAACWGPNSVAGISIEAAQAGRFTAQEQILIPGARDKSPFGVPQHGSGCVTAETARCRGAENRALFIRQHLRRALAYGSSDLVNAQPPVLSQPPTAPSHPPSPTGPFHHLADGVSPCPRRQPQRA